MARTRSLEARASLLALAIATAGGSIHLAVEVALGLGRPEATAPPSCPGAPHRDATEAPDTEIDPSDLDAVEMRCRAAGAARCEVAHAVTFDRAVEATASLFGSDTPDHARLRFSHAHHRVVWTLRAHRAGLSAEVDAFDGAVVEFVAEGVTTN